uniref:MAP6 domain containing 1 n=1 Tax=Oncorhynchus mykiss TaxID=8022 RepID=A0A8C7WKQ2_ONCMY
MAWPCISRVCCLARFWNQFDKSDLSVPLTIQNYSDITDQEVQSVTRQVPTDRDYQQTGVPFSTVTQYKQDYKPWPIPKKENFPWISNVGKGGEVGLDSPVNSNPNASQTRGDMGEREERGRQRWGEQGTVTAKSSYRKQRPPAPYASPGSGVSHLPNETSYQAAYNGGGEAFRHTELHQRDHTPSSSTADLLTPTSISTVPQNTVTPLQPYSIATTTPITTTAGLQQSSLPERPDLSIGTMGEVRGLLFFVFHSVFQGTNPVFRCYFKWAESLM